MRAACLLVLALMQFALQGQDRCAVAQEPKSDRNLEFENWLAATMAARRSARGEATETVMTVPVVFHVVHNGEPVGSGGNLSEERILQQLEVINQDFSRTNPDADQTPSEFVPVASSVDIQFVLARQDPEGLPTTGITRTEGNQNSYRLNDDAALKAEVYWPAEDYLNIYVAELQGFLGWASFPFSNLEGITEIEAERLTDGVVIDFQYIGRNPDTGGTFESFGRTLTHELGHYFGLKHVWGDGGCSADDFCTDTPASNQNYQDQCPSSAQSSCESSDMYSNYLNYTDDACMNLFTVCQRERMRAVLASSPRRVSLLTSSGLEDAVSVTNNMGIRRIITPLQGECNSTLTPMVEVRNYGTNDVQSYSVQMSIDGQTIESTTITSTAQPQDLQIVSFGEIAVEASDPHTFQFAITSVNGGSDNHTANDTLVVTLAPTELLQQPFLEDFEVSGTAFFRTSSEEGTLWGIATAPAELGNNQAAVAQFHEEPSGFGEQHIYLLPDVDLSGLNSAEITFDFAYANSGDHKDGLILAFSRDCGATFHFDDYLFERFGSALKTTVRPVSGAFVPLDEQEWDQMAINVTQLLGIPDLRFGLIAYNGSGNNIYIDNVELSATALHPYDLGIRDVSSLPVVTCSDEIDPRVTVRNYGFEVITDYVMSFDIGNQQSDTFIETLLLLGQEETCRVSINDLSEGAYELTLSVSSPNGNEDGNPSDNVVVRNVVIDNSTETLPIRETFSGTPNWVSTNPTGNSIWERTTAEENIAYRANGFDAGNDGEDHWLVSPVYSTANHQYGSLVFRMAYSEQGTTADRLRVMISASCGNRFEQTLLDLAGSDLSTANGGANFLPMGDNDWREIVLDISDMMAFPDLRVAFVYTNNSGSNLYIDDVEIFPTSADELRRFPAQMWVYPNPAPGGYFNVTINLPRKDDVTIRLVDLSGRTIVFFREPDALNQTFNFEAPGLEGMYLLKVEGSNTNLSGKIQIHR